MGDLKLKELLDDNKFLVRTKKTILSNFNITSSNQVTKTVFLATYLYALGRKNEAQELLESFVYKINYNPVREDLWGSNGQGIILLASIYRDSGNIEKHKQLVSIIKNNDIMSDRESRAVFLKEDLSEHQEILNYYQQESPKYRCQILAQQILTFTYYYEMLSTFKTEVDKSKIDLITKIIKDTSALLKGEIQ